MSRRPDRTGRPARQTRARRLSLEFLEGRELLSLFTVTTAADNGNDASPIAGSLRAEIKLVNADTPGADTIQFTIPGSGVQTINLMSSLPAITHTVAIDGTTQPGYAPNDTPLVVLDGSAAGAGANGLTITSGGSSVVRGLSIVGFTVNSAGAGGEGIYLAGPAGDNLILGDYIGVEPDGSTAKANTSGILAFSAGNTIGGVTALTKDVISGNTYAGVLIAGSAATGNVVLGNAIGTNAAETGALGNQYGILVTGAGDNTIGGTVANSANVIDGNVGPMGNTGAGIIFEGKASGNLVEGNRIGTNRAGTSAILPTAIFPTITYSNLYGIYYGTPGDTSNDNFVQETLGGSVAGAGNLISGNYVGLFGNLASSAIQGNTIGLNLAGTAPISNSDGILLGASLSTIGGSTPLARNVISGSTTVSGEVGTGLNLHGDADLIEGNYIGTNASGLAATGTGNVVGMVLGVTNSTIGSGTIGNGNLVSGNSSDAIDFQVSNDQGSAAGINDVFYGNAIGVDIQGHPDANGGNGIAVTVQAPGSTTTTPTTPLDVKDSIGGTALGQGNVIAHSGGAGVIVVDNYPTGIIDLGIRGNSIAANAALGIDTQGTGEPVASTLFINGDFIAKGQLTVTGVYTGAPSTTVAIDLFANAGDPTGFGQGPTFLGTVSVTTDASGFAIFSPTFAAPAIASPSFSATATGDDGNTSGFSANYPTIAAAPIANLIVRATTPQVPLVIGNTITLTETVYNLGPNAASNVVLYDSLPASFANPTVVASQGSASVGANNVVTVNLGSLAANTLATVTITVNLSQAGSFVDQPGVASTVFDPYYPDNIAQQTITVAPGTAGPTADLAIVQSVTPTSGLVGSPLTYTISVGNVGPNDSSNATVFDTFPAGATLVGVMASQGLTPSIVGNGVTVNLGPLAFGAIATITIVVTPTAAGPATNMAGVSNNGTGTGGIVQYDPNKTNNFTSLTANVTAGVPSIHLYLAQSATTATGTAGQQQGFILTFENFGPNTATNVILNVLLPTNATYVNAIPSQGGKPTVLPNGLLSTNFGTLAAGSVATLQLILMPKSVGPLTSVAEVYTTDVPSATPSYATTTVPIIAGPSVSAINGSGNNSVLILTFNEALNTSTALNPFNYQLVALGKTGTGTPKTVQIGSFTYNPTTHSVSLLPAQALDPTQYYKLTLIGSTASGLADTQGRRLASTLYGAAGSNFSATFLAGTLPQI